MAIPKPARNPRVTQLAAGPFGPRINRLALVTDAWKPQTNGVVNTLVRLVKHLELEGMEVMVVAPALHRSALRFATQFGFLEHDGLHHGVALTRES